jgi:glycerate-2-kinase
VADPTTFDDALEVIERYEATVPSAVMHRLQAGAAGHAPETPKPGDLQLERASIHVVAAAGDALAGARDQAQALGYRAEVVADDMEGEARDVARQIVELALSRRRTLIAGDPPLALLLGGETTVTVRGDGRGGRNQEMALALAIELDGRDGILAASMGTDGADGPTDAAGGIVDGETLSRVADASLDARESLDRNDSNTFLRAADALLVTGPTGTNVGDVVLVLIQPPGE